MTYSFKTTACLALAIVMNACFFTTAHAADLLKVLEQHREQKLTTQESSLGSGTNNQFDYISSLPKVKQNFNFAVGFSQGTVPPLISWHSRVSLLSCSNSCLGNPLCHSFSYAKEIQACKLFPDTRFDRPLFNEKALGGDNRYYIVEYFGKKDVEAAILNNAAIEKQKREQQFDQQSKRRTLVFLAGVENFHRESLKAYVAGAQDGTLQPRAGSVLPDLFGTWTTNYGTINWLDATYGANGDTLSMRVPRWDYNRQAYVMTGWWRGRENKEPGGEVSFVFDGECSFTGSWNREPANIATHSGKEGMLWTGRCNEFDNRAATAARQQQELQEAAELQRRQQEQEAARLRASNRPVVTPGPGKPSLTGQWTSTYGDIHWEQNWYGEQNNILIMHAPNWDQARQEWVE